MMFDGVNVECNSLSSTRRRLFILIWVCLLRMHTKLAIDEPGDLTPEALDSLCNDMGGLYNSISAAYFR